MTTDEGSPPVAPDSGPGIDGDRAGRLVRVGLIFYGVMGCAGLVWRMAAGGDSILHPSVAAAETAWSTGPSILAGIVLGGALLGASELLTRFTEFGAALSRALGESLAGLGVGDAILLAIASGFAEELFFRGAMQAQIGLFWATLLFALAHLAPTRDLLPWTGFAAVAGLALGGVYLLTGNLIAPVVGHMLVNGVNLPRLIREQEARLREEAAARERGGE